MSDDLSGINVPLESKSILPESILDDIACQLGLEPFAEEIRKELRILTKRYAFDQKIFGTYESHLQAVGADYKALKKKVSEFRTFLQQPEYIDLESDLHLAALHRNEAALGTDFPGITKFERTRGKPYLLELERLLSLLEDATDLALDNSVSTQRKTVSTQRKTAQAIRSKIGYECEHGRRDQTLDSEA